MLNNIKQLLQTHQNLQQKQSKAVLATIIETMGSTYQKAGARMLIEEDGEFRGILSGGCFESDLREQAKSVFEDGKSKIIFYDMRSPDDEIWGLGLGCNGAVRVHLQLLTEKNSYSPLNIIEKVNRNDDIGVLATICASNHTEFQENKSIFLPTINKNNQLTIDFIDETHTANAQRVLLQDKPELVTKTIDNKEVTIFYDLVKPPRKLLLLGAGPDAVPVTHFAKTLGWHVTVIDHRPAYIKPERFPDVDTLLNIVPDELNEKISLEQFDALVVMTHSIDNDERYLKTIANSPVPYIGLLGPAKRRDRLLESLALQAEKIKGRVYGPTGLDIGAQSPEEIALSIMAEIQAVLSQRDGGQLKQINEPIQERQLAN